MKARLADLGGDVLALSPADFGKLIADETEKWGTVIRALRRGFSLSALLFAPTVGGCQSDPGAVARASLPGHRHNFRDGRAVFCRICLGRDGEALAGVAFHVGR
jgi:hypothetical protein